MSPNLSRGASLHVPGKDLGIDGSQLPRKPWHAALFLTSESANALSLGKPLRQTARLAISALRHSPRHRLHPRPMSRHPPSRYALGMIAAGIVGIGGAQVASSGASAAPSSAQAAAVESLYVNTIPGGGSRSEEITRSTSSRFSAGRASNANPALISTSISGQA